MNIIIIGGGEIGRFLAMHLSKGEHNICLIEEKQELVEDFSLSINARIMSGDGSSISILAEASVEYADLVLAVTSSNNTNIMAAAIAKKMGAKKVIARVHPSFQREEWILDYRQHFGIDYVFSPERLSAVELAKFVLNPDSISVEELSKGQIEIQQIRVSENSNLLATPLLEMKLPDRTRIAFIQREGDYFIPSAQDILQAHDIVTIFGEPHGLQKVVDLLKNKDSKKKAVRVVIFGGGEYGIHLAQLLSSWHCKVRIFEKSKQQAEKVAVQISNVEVIYTAESILSDLEEEQVGEADFFIATSSYDEENVMSCLQAFSLGLQKSLTLIHRSDYARAIHLNSKQLGIIGAVSPREATLRDIERFITSEKYHIIKTLPIGDIIEVVIAEKAPICNEKLQQISWPKDCVLVGLNSGTITVVPHYNDIMQAGAVLYAIVTEDNRKAFLKLVGCA